MHMGNIKKNWSSLCEVLFLCGAYSSHEVRYYITCALSIVPIPIYVWRLLLREERPIYRQFRHPPVMTHWLAAITGKRSKYGENLEFNFVIQIQIQIHGPFPQDFLEMKPV